jgi:hypothetical protein
LVEARGFSIEHIVTKENLPVSAERSWGSVLKRSPKRQELCGPGAALERPPALADEVRHSMRG